MKVCMLASSSKGNCTVVWNDKFSILIDCGITLSDVEARLERIGVDPKSIIAIIVTHEHSDHIKGISAFIRKYHSKLYVHADGYDALVSKLDRVPFENIVEFFSDFAICDFEIHPFKLPHDAKCCVGYTIKESDKKISIITDLGYTNTNILSNVYGSRLVILESNYDERMLRLSTKYPLALKNRIRGQYGHLSNRDSANAICELACNGVKQILLAHLSEENNTPDLCYESVCQMVRDQGVIPGQNIMIDVAPARNISTLFTLK